jgi:hypothetical protein
MQSTEYSEDSDRLRLVKNTRLVRDESSLK